MAEVRRRAPPGDPVFAVIEPAVKVGAACGGAGFLFGGTAGILRGTTPFLFAAASGLQTFGLGTIFWGCRSTILEIWKPENQTSADRVKASTASGGITGAAMALLTRGRSNVIPGALMFSLFGFLGQIGYNKYNERRDVDEPPKPGFWKRMSEKSWSPVTVMTNDEYTEMLKEKMLKIDVEISILEDRIQALREQQKEGSDTPSETALSKD